MAGFVAAFRTSIQENTIENMLDTMAYRGRDYRHHLRDGALEMGYLGMDLGYAFDRKEICQREKTTVLLTGYVNNVDEVRAYAEKRGVAESSSLTPAEAIAVLYEIEGTEVASVLKGGYVVLIYDKETGALIVFRDRFAVQPVYYYQTKDGGIVFSSETKAFLALPSFEKKFNKDALVPYLIFQSPTLEETFFQGVFTFAPATVMTVTGEEEGGVQLTKRQYWDVAFAPQEMELEEASKAINALVERSIAEKTKYFAHPDTIGQSLSGGVDSSYLASRIRPKETFTVGYHDQEFSEIDNARDLSKIIGATHYSEIVDSEKTFSELSTIAYLGDQPFANLSAVPMFYLSKQISEHTHAVFSGEGSDEFFGGYFEYTEPKYMNVYKLLPTSLRRAIGRRMLKSTKDFKGKNFMIKGMPTEDWYIGQAKIFHEAEARHIVHRSYRYAPRVQELLAPYFEQVRNLSDIQKKQYLDFHVWMVNDIALKADRMNIGHGVQLVTPLLDEDLLDFARTLPDELKIQGTKVKIAFRHAALNYLPEEWATRKKKGYVVPLKNWLKEPKYSAIITEMLTGELAAQFFDVSQLKELIEENLSGKRAQHRKIWTVYMFLLWYQEYFVKR